MQSKHEIGDNLNFAAKPRIERLDNGFPILIIDNFYLDPDRVRKRALDGHFARMEAGYPGRHEPLSMEEDDVLITLTFIRELVKNAAQVDFDYDQMSTDFSVLTTPSKNIHKNQSNPHTDGVALAGVLYLNPTSMGGTCFYKNKVLDSYTLTPENSAQWEAYQDESGYKNTKGYVSGDFDIWELAHKTTGQYNQLVMYLGNVFHSVDVTVDPDPHDLSKARLTQRFFINQLSPTSARD